MNKIEEIKIESLEEFINYGKSIGKLIKSRNNGDYLDLLTPVMKEDVKRKSLSKIYGIEDFPFHTDCAYINTPPRYIILRYVGSMEYTTPTLVKEFDLTNFNDKEIDFLKTSIWLLKGQNGFSYSKIFQNGYYRYDPNIMVLKTPVENLMPQIIKKLKTIEVTWSKNKCVLIDNWFCLHSRPKVEKEEINRRIIQRLNIAI